MKRCWFPDLKIGITLAVFNLSEKIPVDKERFIMLTRGFTRRSKDFFMIYKDMFSYPGALLQRVTNFQEAH